MKNSLFLILGAAVIIWSFYIFLNKPAPAKYQTNIIVVEGKTLQVEVADTEAKRSLGLSGRESLPPGTGMLFVFESPTIPAFWMREMHFPIDIIWLEREGEGFKIIDIEENVSPETFPQTFSPSIPVKYVLETNPGELN